MNKVCTFVMLVNYYYIFGLKKALVTALFLRTHQDLFIININQTS